MEVYLLILQSQFVVFSLSHDHRTINNQSFNHQSKFMINWVHAQIIQHRLWLWMDCEWIDCWFIGSWIPQLTINHHSTPITILQFHFGVCMHVCYSTLLWCKINHSQAFYFCNFDWIIKLLVSFVFVCVMYYASCFFNCRRTQPILGKFSANDVFYENR
jgi:hypothetical protein